MKEKRVDALTYSNGSHNDSPVVHEIGDANGHMVNDLY